MRCEIKNVCQMQITVVHSEQRSGKKILGWNVFIYRSHDVFAGPVRDFTDYPECICLHYEAPLWQQSSGLTRTRSRARARPGQGQSQGKARAAVVWPHYHKQRRPLIRLALPTLPTDCCPSQHPAAAAAAPITLTTSYQSSTTSGRREY